MTWCYVSEKIRFKRKRPLKDLFCAEVLGSVWQKESIPSGAVPEELNEILGAGL